MRSICPELAEGQIWHEGEMPGCFYTYILLCADESYYVGATDDPPRRLREHNEGKGSAWTAARRPVKIVWTEAHDSLSAARKRENQLKRWSRAKKEALIGGSLRLRPSTTLGTSSGQGP